MRKVGMGGSLPVALVPACLAMALLASPSAARKDKQVKTLTEQEIARIEQAAPGKAPAKPARPRKVLVWGRLWTHEPNPYAVKALEVLGRKSGAFQAAVSDDPNALLPARLADFDALVMNNIHEPEPFMPRDWKALPKERQEAARALDAAAKKSILEFVSGGRGLAGIHAATAACQGWKEYLELIGGVYATHIAGDVAVKLDDPAHPVNACFAGKGFRIDDEIYIFKEPYSRKAVRVLLSLDLSAMPDPAKRPDRDYAVSWVRSHGKGRVFYTTLGHNAATYWNAQFLEHLLAGLQFVIGDLAGEAAPAADAGR